MQAQRRLTLGQKGAKNFIKHYGEQLVSGPLSLRRTVESSRNPRSSR